MILLIMKVCKLKFNRKFCVFNNVFSKYWFYQEDNFHYHLIERRPHLLENKILLRSFHMY